MLSARRRVVVESGRLAYKLRYSTAGSGNRIPGSHRNPLSPLPVVRRYSNLPRNKSHRLGRAVALARCC